MGQEKILNIFFENPTRNYHIREISRILGISKTNVNYHVNKFLDKDLVVRDEKGVFTSFRANESNLLYRFYKKEAILKKIFESKFLDFLEKEFNPKSVFLFGSFAKGEYDSNSDIDLFVQARMSKVNLKKYEKIFGHEINLFFEPNVKKLSPELLNNIVNGIKLGGYLKVK